jgi:Inner membrane protein YgaP-like, transmembrane domain
MNVERSIRLIAGSLVLISAILAWKVSPWFLVFIAFVGLNLMQSAFTNWCPMMTILRKMGVPDDSKEIRPAETVA